MNSRNMKLGLARLAAAVLVLSLRLPPAAHAQDSVATTIYLPLVMRDHRPPVYLRTRIDNITTFLEKCPTADPAYARIRNDFIIRRDGAVVGDILCSEPFSAQPISQLTNELVALQVLRMAHYMDPGVPNHLPWTSQSLYDWMASRVGGVNLKTAPGQLYCCDSIDGRLYISQSLQSEAQREFKRNWSGIRSTLDFFAHEVRHSDGGPGHVTGCAAFPDPGGPAGCDDTYDPANLGSYGIQYWLNTSWLTGYLHVGLSCDPAQAQAYAISLVNSINSFRNRFVNNVPAVAALPAPPYGGPCFAP